MKGIQIEPDCIGKIIRERRKAMGIRQCYLAERVGISTNSLCLIEYGKTMPHRGTLTKILKELGLSLMIVEIDEASPSVEQMRSVSENERHRDEYVARLKSAVNVLCDLLNNPVKTE